MRIARTFYLASLCLLSACADAANDDEIRELRAYLEGDTRESALDPEKLNAAFASLAVRARGYNSVEQAAESVWSPVVNVTGSAETPTDISTWLTQSDIDSSGLFTPCLKNACAEIEIGTEERASIGPWLTSPADLERAVRLKGAALRLMPQANEIAWSSAIAHGMVFYAESQRVEINPRLLALIAERELPQIKPSPEVVAPALESAEIYEQTSRPQNVQAPLRTHEPPEGFSSDSSDCDCDVFDIDCTGNSSNRSDSCAIAGRAPEASGKRYINPQLVFAFVAAALVVRRARRRARELKRSWRRSGSAVLRLLRLFTLLLIAFAAPTAHAQAPDAAARITAGKAHLARSDYAAAITEFEAARAAGAGREVYEPLAKAYEAAGRLPEAYALLSELLADEATLKTVDRDRLQKQAQAIESRIAFINVQVEPATAQVLIDGNPAVVDPRSKQFVIIPGQRRITARAQGYADAEQTITAQPASRNTVVNLKLTGNTAIFEVQAFAPDATIAVDGVPVGQGRWSGPVAAGPHLVQVYRPGGPNYNFQVTAVAGQTQQIPPPGAVAPAIVEPPPPTKSPHKYRVGPYVLAHVGVMGMTAKPDGFRYELRRDNDTNTTREGGGATFLVGATGGFRLSRGFGIGALVMYGRGGGEGTVSQLETVSTGGTQTHEGPADFTQQFLRFGPHFRFMAGGDRARFLAGTGLGTVYSWVDLEHVNVVAAGGALVASGTYHHDYSGWNPYWAFDLGAEFSLPAQLLLGISFDVFVDRTTNISGNPFGGTAQGYVGISARIGYHNWKPE